MMNRINRAGFALLAVSLMATAAPAPARALTNLFLLHHSVGRNILEEGNVRQLVGDYNSLRGTQLALWDHDYNAIGLTDPDGDLADRFYDIPDDDTYVIGLHKLWTTSNSARDSILANHQMIAFKSCYEASLIESDAMLAQYKTWYLDIRDELDLHQDRIFLLMSPPPMHPCLSTDAVSDRARAFADWLGSSAFLAGHPNLHYFDLFDVLAAPRDATDRNTLRAIYCRSTSCSSPDSHPNTDANLVVAPLFVAALIEAAGESVVGVPGTGPIVDASFMAVYPNPFNPMATIRYDLSAAARVRLNIYDLGGRLVRTLVDGEAVSAGRQEVSWDGHDEFGRQVSAGAYFCRLEANAFRGTIRMMLVK